ncbi:MAG: glycosyltransferase [Deltaproteobacteria bacterium]|nr:glycosyltransferase [Deltaproteobacteria bacterium]
MGNKNRSVHLKRIVLERPRIAIIIASFQGGGAERAMLNFARGAIALGHSVDVLVISASGPLMESVPAAARVINLNCSRAALALPGLIKYLQREKPAALYATVAHVNTLAIIAAKLSGSPAKVIVRESSAPSAEQIHTASARITHALSHALYRYSDGIIAVSNGVRDKLASLMPAAAEKIRVLPTPVIDEYIFSLAEGEIEHPWLKNRELPVILGAGRLVEEKNFALLIRAFQAVVRRRPARLVILGEGRLRSSLTELIDRLDLNHSVSMPGFRVNPFPYLKHCDLFVLSSVSEGMPNVLLQAMSFGTPVVATDCQSGPRECLSDGYYGDLVPLNDPASLSEAMLRSIDSHRRNDAAAYVMQNYSVSAATKAYLSLAGIGTISRDTAPRNEVPLLAGFEAVQ